MKRIKQFIKYTFLFYALITCVYWIIIRSKCMQWGATTRELNMRLPGDEQISSRSIVSTRALNIYAAKENIWPWIAQTGQNKGGFHSYYWLENLFGAGMVNADIIYPAWQNPKYGDTVYYGENMPYGLLSLVKTNEYYSIQGWLFYLQPVDCVSTRLIVRYPSMEIKQNLFGTFYYYVQFESLHFIMESGMMMGIKEKAEKYTKR